MAFEPDPFSLAPESSYHPQRWPTASALTQ